MDNCKVMTHCQMSRQLLSLTGHAREDVKEILKEHINKLARRDSQQSG